MPKPQVIVLSDVWGDAQVDSDVFDLEFVHGPSVPSPTDMARADLILLIGPLNNASRALELSGAIKLALENGSVVVFLYAARFGEVDVRFFEGLHTLQTRSLGGSLRPIVVDPAPHEAFREYCLLHGQTDQTFPHPSEDAEVVAYAKTVHSPPQAEPAAVRLTVSNGDLYVLPQHVNENAGPFLERLVSAIQEHRDGRLLDPPPFLASLTLPGEEAARAALHSVQAEVQQRESEHQVLLRHKLLLSHIQGTALEQLVIEELNVVLDPSSLIARDIEERYAEDFEIIEGANRVAICEAKGVNRGINLNDVNQVNSHRTELFEASADELPGLLVVNTFRKANELDARKTAVDPRVQRHARRINVLALRTWDLYHLTARRLGDNDDSHRFRELLMSGGGWLEVDGDGLRVHTG